MCPAGWFTCAGGTNQCIEISFKCDCNNDCTDGSDETEIYAGCSASTLSVCTALKGSTGHSKNYKYLRQWLKWSNISCLRCV